MIRLVPSMGIVKDTKIDFKLVELIINQFLDIPQSLTLKVEKNQSSWSGYWSQQKKIKINLGEGTSLKYVISTLLHEIRHAEQKANYKNISFIYKNYTHYYNSPEEKDARRFERLTTDVCNIYNGLQSVKNKYSSLCLRQHRELLYNNKK